MNKILDTKAKVAAHYKATGARRKVGDTVEVRRAVKFNIFQGGTNMKKVGPVKILDGRSKAARAAKQVTSNDVTPATATEFLMKASMTMDERGKQYDSPGGERSMGKAVTVFNIITGQDLSEAEGWLFMQGLKDVRQWANPAYHQGNAEDAVSYAALKAEALAVEGGVV